VSAKGLWGVGGGMVVAESFGLELSFADLNHATIALFYGAYGLCKLQPKGQVIVVYTCSYPE